MAEVFLCQAGQITTGARRDLKRAGIVVVEVEDPSRCQFIRSSEVISGDDMLWATLKALNESGDAYNRGTHQRAALASHLLTIVDGARSGGAS